MRRLAWGGCALLVLMGLPGCKREPTFEERYAGAEKAIRQKAAELDKDMGRRAAEAQAVASDMSATQEPGQAPGKT
jgi:hypothetical protein